MLHAATNRNRSTGDSQQSSRPSFRLRIRGFPHQIYVMMFLSFVVMVGKYIAFPYLWMYLYDKNGGLNFDPSLLGLMVFTGVVSAMIALPVAGSLCDRLGRRKTMGIFLISQSILVPVYAYARTFDEFLLLYASVCALGAFYDPSFSAMVADLVEPARREEVFGLSYMTSNMAAAVGSPIGGMVVQMSGYPILFVYAAFFLVTGFAIFSFFIKESRLAEVNKVTPPRFATVFRDRLLFLFLFTAAFTNMVYSQFYTLLSVYIKDAGFETFIYGLLFALNSGLVVTLQIPVRKGAMKLGATKSFMLAQLFFTIGSAYFMFAIDLYQFVIAITILTLGEITFFPSSSGFVANLAPPEMRGRYMSLMVLFFNMGVGAGALFAFNTYGALALAEKRLIWGILGLVGAATLPGYLTILRVAGKRKNVIVEKKEHVCSSVGDRKS
jgi:predicted MFS family arabinose efflux permease